jgi:hypothetical protein
MPLDAVKSQLLTLKTQIGQTAAGMPSHEEYIRAQCQA